MGNSERWNSSDKLALVLFCLGSAMALALYWMEKTPLSATLSLLAIVVLLVYPIFHVFSSWKTRTFTTILMLGLVGFFGWAIWPKRQTKLDSPLAQTSAPVPQQTAPTPASAVPPVVNKTKTSKQDAFTFSGTSLSPDIADKFFAEASHPGMQLLVTAERPVQHIAFQVHCNVPCVYSRGYGVTTAYAAGNVQSSPDSKLLSFPLDIPARLDVGQQLILLFRSKDDRQLSSLQAQVASENVDKPCVHPNLNIGELHADHVHNVFLLSGNPCIAVGKATITNSENGVVYTTKPHE